MILTIFKVIGIILLVLLLLIIFILALLLLVPIKYRFDAEYFEKPDVLAVVRFLPVGLNAKVTFKENDLKYTIKVLGGVIMTNTDAKLSWLGRKISGEDNNTELSESGEIGVINTENNINSNNVNEYDDTDDADNKENIVNKDNKDNKENTGNKDIIDKTDSYENKDSLNNIDGKNSKKKKKTKDDRPLSKKITDKIDQFKKKYVDIKDKLRKLNKKKDALLNVYGSKRFEAAKKDVIRYFKELLSAMKPEHIDGRIHFGLDDPAATGEIIGGLSTFLPIYDGIIDIRPDFDKQIIEGVIKGYGKIRIISFVKVGIKVLFNRNLIKVIKRVQTILEA